MRADKTELQNAYNTLTEQVSTEGKTPASIKSIKTLKLRFKIRLMQLKMKLNKFLDNENPSVEQVNNALNNIKAVQPKLDSAIHLLENKANNNELVTARNQLQEAINNQPSTTGMTQDSINNYNAKRADAQSAINLANSIIDNGDATAQQIADEKSKVNQALQA